MASFFRFRKFSRSKTACCRLPSISNYKYAHYFNGRERADLEWRCRHQLFASSFIQLATVSPEEFEPKMICCLKACHANSRGCDASRTGIRAPALRGRRATSCKAIVVSYEAGSLFSFFLSSFPPLSYFLFISPFRHRWCSIRVNSLSQVCRDQTRQHRHPLLARTTSIRTPFQ